MASSYYRRGVAGAPAPEGRAAVPGTGMHARVRVTPASNGDGKEKLHCADIKFLLKPTAGRYLNSQIAVFYSGRFSGTPSLLG